MGAGDLSVETPEAEVGSDDGDDGRRPAVPPDPSETGASGTAPDAAGAAPPAHPLPSPRPPARRPSAGAWAHPGASLEFDPGPVVAHWERPSDIRMVRRWQRRLAYKKMLWRATYGLAETTKRGLDVAGSLAAIAAFSPVFVGTALLIKLEDGGPVLFHQDRVGRGGRVFKMIKFRSMVVDADRLKDTLLNENQHGDEAVTFKMKEDPRITRVGRFIRKYSIDEFPQFFNVLFGQMSLVGPRPPVPREVAKYKAMHLRRLAVKPGITCLWQVGGRAEIDFEGQVRLDLEYIASESVWNDIKILLKTVPAVIRGDGAY